MNKQIAEYIGQGMTEEAAHNYYVMLFGVLPDADSVTDTTAEFRNAKERRVMDDNLAAACYLKGMGGDTNAALAYVRIQANIQKAVSTGSTDEFAHLSIAELKRLAGEF